MVRLTGQRMVSSRRNGSVMFWAWMVSIGVHLIVLGAFGIVRFSQSKVQSKRWSAPVSEVKKFMQAAPVVPKPKVKSPVESRRVSGAKRIVGGIRNRRYEMDIRQSRTSNTSVGTVRIQKWVGNAMLPGGVDLPKGIEFFGSWTEQRKVCYLVDCSGSMRGTFGRVQKELKESISGLQPDQYFYIIFFGGNKLFEFGDGRLLRATQEAKLAACDFIDLVKPVGRTNAFAAMEKAVQIGDSGAQVGLIIYLLTDGFELTAGDEQKFPQRVEDLLRRFAPETKINTIGFWPQSDDRRMLEAIAAQSSGEFVFVTDGVSK